MDELFEAGLRSSICTEVLVQPEPSPRMTMKLGWVGEAANELKETNCTPIIIAKSRTPTAVFPHVAHAMF
jgi:hypothetical protein